MTMIANPTGRIESALRHESFGGAAAAVTRLVQALGLPLPAHAVLAAAAFAQVVLGTALADAGAGGGLSRRLCRTAGGADCASVLASRHARWHGIPLAGLGAGHALAVYLLSLVAGLAPALAGAAWALAAILLTLGLIAATWFVRVQARVLRRWCAACNAFHAAGAIGAVAAWSGLATAVAGPLPAGAWAATGLIALLALALPIGFGRMREQSEELRDVRAQWARLTADPEVVAAAWRSRTPLPVAEARGEWIVGRPGAPVEVVTYSHPLCPHCAGAHAEAEAWLAAAPEVRLVTRLVVPDPPAEAPDLSMAATPARPTESAAVLYALGAVRGPVAFHAALGQVFAAQEEFAALPALGWARRLGLGPEELERGMPEGWARLRADAELARRLDLKHVPVVFVNGRPLPGWASAGARRKLVESFVWEKQRRG